MNEKFRPYFAVYLILKKDGKMLLSRRLNTGYHDGKYSLVSGHCEGHETARQAIIREAQEEAGIVLSPNDLTVEFVMHRWRPEREYIDVYLTANKWDGEITNLEPDKCSDLTWYSEDELPSDLIEEVRFALEQIKKGEHYGEWGWN